MKKIKKISVRISQLDYNIMFRDYLRLKVNPGWTKLIYNQEINTFSDYIRVMLNKGMND